MNAIADMTCAGLTQAYRNGVLSPVEAAQDVLARIERHAKLNAFLPIEPDAVLAAAKESEARWRAGARNCSPRPPRTPRTAPRWWCRPT